MFWLDGAAIGGTLGVAQNISGEELLVFFLFFFCVKERLSVGTILRQREAVCRDY